MNAISDSRKWRNNAFIIWAPGYGDTADVMPKMVTTFQNLIWGLLGRSLASCHSKLDVNIVLENQLQGVTHQKTIRFELCDQLLGTNTQISDQIQTVYCT